MRTVMDIYDMMYGYDECDRYDGWIRCMDMIDGWI